MLQVGMKTGENIAQARAQRAQVKHAHRPAAVPCSASRRNNRMGRRRDSSACLSICQTRMPLPSSHPIFSNTISGVNVGSG